MLAIEVVTIFPRMIQAPLDEGIVRRARDRGLVDVRTHDLRDFTDDRHRTVDDAPFGGGPGMVMKAEPFLRAVESVLPQRGGSTDAVVLLSPRGRRLDHETADRYSRLEHLVLLCGRYEGIDERVRQALACEEVSLGDFVLTGGEVAALALIEATVRLIPGAIGDEASAEADSFAEGILDCPHYTRPAVVRGLGVPDVLLSGDHERVRRWRRKEALRATLRVRPDLLSSARLGPEDEGLLREVADEWRVAAAEAACEEAVRAGSS
jgi:tRNA (guanine37-N1)-methyltransferase